MLLVSPLPGRAAVEAARAEPAPPFVEAKGSRTFSVEYVAVIPAPPTSTRQLRVWLPVPRTTPVQTIRDLSFSEPPLLTREDAHGNRFAYWEVSDPRAPLRVTMNFVCTRHELRADLARLSRAGEGVDQAISYAAFLRPSRLAVVNESTRKLGGQITGSLTTTLERAHAIYEYVLGHMRYDKTMPGWGTGSTQFACDTGRGNCTDFHSLFDSLCRSEGIGAEFEIGLLLPYERSASQPLGGYHCWTYFRVPGRAWVPVDCSEASLQPRLREYLFGSQTNNRVTLSVGRDIVLNPAQAGPPLNFFVDPYAEADDRPVAASKTWTFKDLD